MGQSKLDLLQGTLDVMVLQTLEAMGPQHGYGVTFDGDSSRSES